MFLLRVSLSHKIFDLGWSLTLAFIYFTYSYVHYYDENQHVLDTLFFILLLVSLMILFVAVKNISLFLQYHIICIYSTIALHYSLRVLACTFQHPGICTVNNRNIMIRTATSILRFSSYLTQVVFSFPTDLPLHFTRVSERYILAIILNNTMKIFFESPLLSFSRTSNCYFFWKFLPYQKNCKTVLDLGLYWNPTRNHLHFSAVFVDCLADFVGGKAFELINSYETPKQEIKYKDQQ